MGEQIQLPPSLAPETRDLKLPQWAQVKLATLRIALLERLRSEGPHPESGEKPRVVRLGLGEVIVDTGTHGGTPAVFIERAPTTGVVGDKGQAGAFDEVAPGSVIIECHGPAQVLIDALLKLSPPPLEGAGRAEDGLSRSQPVLSPKSDNAVVWLQWNQGWNCWEHVASEHGGEPGTIAYTPVTQRPLGVFEALTRLEEMAEQRLDFSEDMTKADAVVFASDVAKVKAALADGDLGRQDEVVQLIRDEPISSSKGEALPVAWRAEFIREAKSLIKASGSDHDMLANCIANLVERAAFPAGRAALTEDKAHG